MQSELPPNRLRELREGRELKLYDIAARFRVDPSTAYRWEEGRSQVPDLVKLELAAFYSVSAAYLMGWEAEVAA